MDIVFIRGLIVTTIIGVYSWERSFCRKLIFDLDIGYNNKVSIYSNSKDYFDYQEISNFVVMLVRKSHFFLLESLAENVAEELIYYFNIPWIRVRVSKPGAISKDIHVGVIIERTRDKL